MTTGSESADRGTIAAYSAGDSAVTATYIAADAVVATGCTTGIAAAIASLSELSHQNNTTVLTALPSTASFTTLTIGTNTVATQSYTNNGVTNAIISSNDYTNAL